MKPVTNIVRLPLNKEETRIFGGNARKKCEITLGSDLDKETFECYMDQEKINDFIRSFNEYLTNLLKEKKKERITRIKKNNMKNSLNYAIGLIGLVAAFLASEPIGIPFFLAAALVGLVPAIITNIDAFMPFENLQDVREIHDKLEKLEVLAKEAQMEQANYKVNEQKRFKSALYNAEALEKSKIEGIDLLKESINRKLDWHERKDELSRRRRRVQERLDDMSWEFMEKNGLVNENGRVR